AGGLPGLSRHGALRLLRRAPVRAEGAGHKARAAARPDHLPGSPIVNRLRTTVIPLLLMICTPPIIVLLWITCSRYDGSLERLVREADFGTLAALWPMPSLAAAKIIGTFALLEAALMIALPGRKHLGPVTPSGDRPSYKLNGVAAFVLTHALLYFAAYK